MAKNKERRRYGQNAKKHLAWIETFLYLINIPCPINEDRQAAYTY